MRLWKILLVLAIGGFVGFLIKQDPGYTLFAYKNWTMEMPLWLAVIFLILIIMISFFIIWLLNLLFSSTGRAKHWWKQHQLEAARRKTARGLLELTEGRWQKAERYLIQSAPLSDTPLINYLSAAKAAEEGGSKERRDRYLQLASSAHPGSEVAVKLTEAQLQFEHGQLEQSAKTLERLYSEKPKHPQVLKLLCVIYEATGNWEALYHLLPSIYKSQLFQNKEDLSKLEYKIYRAIFPKMAEKDGQSLIRFFHDSPRSIQSNPEIIADYAKLLLQHQDYKEAEGVLRKALEKYYTEDLIHLYGLIPSSSPKKQLNFAESLLKEHSNSSMLLLTLGRLCVNLELWGKAKDYLELSISLQERPETYALLAEVLDKLGFHKMRDDCFKKGLLCATHGAAHNSV